MKISFKSLVGLSLFVIGILFVSNYNSIFSVKQADAKVCIPGPSVTATTNIDILAGGSVTPTSINANCFPQKATFTISPSSSYNINSVTGCSGTLNGFDYTTSDLGVTGNCTVYVSFVKNITTLPTTYPTITSFTSDALNNSVMSGSTVKLSWKTTGAVRCDIYGPGIDTKNDTTTINNVVSLSYPNGVGLNSSYKTKILTSPTNTFTLTCDDGNINTSNSSATTKGCYTGFWATGDTVHPGGGRVTYTDGNNNSITVTDIWINQTTVINYLNGTTQSNIIGAKSISCTVSTSDICDSNLQCCTLNTSTGFLIPGPPCILY